MWNSRAPGIPPHASTRRAVSTKTEPTRKSILQQQELLQKGKELVCERNAMQLLQSDDGNEEFGIL